MILYTAVCSCNDFGNVLYNAVGVGIGAGVTTVVVDKISKKPVVPEYRPDRIY